MKVKITCNCNASFEIKDGNKHPEEICCPNCGNILPDDASQDLLSMLNSFSLLKSKLEESSYDILLTSE